MDQIPKAPRSRMSLQHFFPYIVHPLALVHSSEHLVPSPAKVTTADQGGLVPNMGLVLGEGKKV